ncbi:hypothetical protein A8B75_18675 [Sphingomonadales bacterium EhC05]|nr:hypothetical protein A8B75_18675 [Sphingomonadales bacterium EhC05]
MKPEKPKRCPASNKGLVTGRVQEVEMKSTFNKAALAHLTLSDLCALLAEYRCQLGQAGLAERPQIAATVTAIEIAIIIKSGPG